MSIRFNAEEVFAMAEQIETAGEAYYRKAAKLTSAKSAATTLTRLADMEKQHRATFAAMRANLPDALRQSDTFDPYLEANLYLQSMADSHGGEGAPAATASLTGSESLATILATAIGLEQKSILFYGGLRDLVPASLGQSQVDAIIAEEKDHLVVLVKELRAAKE